MKSNNNTINKAQSFNVGFSNKNYGNNGENDDDAKDRLKALGNKKGISSEDIFGKADDKT